MINAANGIAQGSARSIEGFDLLAAISSCSEHLDSFGGHKMAAGITIETRKVQEFSSQLEAYAKENLNEKDIIAKITRDVFFSILRWMIERYRLNIIIVEKPVRNSF